MFFNVVLDLLIQMRKITTNCKNVLFYLSDSYTVIDKVTEGIIHKTRLPIPFYITYYIFKIKYLTN